AYRLTGSSDLYEGTGRRPLASINFVTAHDGFTLRDLVSYNEKHNETNGEDNRDGESDNRSWNCGVEGPTDDPEVQACRARQARNSRATLFLSQGVPMLLMGDEAGRTQHGNNNAYAQDSDLSYFQWQEVDGDLLEFTARLIKFRRDHPVFRQRRWFLGPTIHGSVADIGWFRPDGEPMTDEEWTSGFAKTLTVFLNGDAITSRDPRGERIVAESFLIVFNAHWETVRVRLPGGLWGKQWQPVLDTATSASEAPDEVLGGGEEIQVAGRSLRVLRRLSVRP